MFGRSESALSEIANYTTVWLAEHWRELIYFDAIGMSQNAERFAKAVSRKCNGAADCVFAFVDGTAIVIARPVEDQRLSYSGHHRLHELLYQAIVNPDGIVRSTFGPLPGIYRAVVVARVVFMPSF
jgi:hypothetical protein